MYEHSWHTGHVPGSLDDLKHLRREKEMVLFVRSLLGPCGLAPKKAWDVLNGHCSVDLTSMHGKSLSTLLMSFANSRERWTLKDVQNEWKAMKRENKVEGSDIASTHALLEAHSDHVVYYNKYDPNTGYFSVCLASCFQLAMLREFGREPGSS